MSSPTLPSALLEELRSRNHRVRTTACAELGEHLAAGRRTTVDLLIERLGDEHPQVRLAAAEALTQGPAAEIEGELRDALRHLSGSARPGHRASIVHALGLLERPCSGPLCRALLTELSHGDTDVRFHAVASLNRLECASDEYRAVLPRLLDDVDDEVAAVAATAAADFAMAQVLPQVLPRWRRASGFARRQLALAAAHLGSDEVLGTLEDAIRSGFDGLAAIEALVALATGPAHERLRWAARSWRVHPVLRARAGVALLELGDDDAEQLVSKYLSSRRTELRCGTIEWLGRTRQTPFVPRLVAILHERRHRDSAVAAHALGFMGISEVLEPLREAALSDPRPDVRQEAAAALNRLEAERR